MPFDVDTSSYPKPATPTSSLDVAGKLGSLQQQSLSIDQAKLDQANQALTYLTRGLNSLGPNPTREQLISVGKSVVDKGLAPASMLDSMIKDIPTDPKMMPAFIDRLNTQTAEHQQMINHFRGPLYTNQSGQRTDVLQIPGSPNYPIQPRASIPTEAPPTSKTVSPETGQESTIGNVPPPPAQGFNRLQAVPPAVPPLLPQRPDVNAGPALVPNKPQDRVSQGGSFPTAPTPLFEEGKKQFANDQELATQKLTAIKPAIQALPLIGDLTTGIGTETYNRALAGLNNLGLLPAGMTNKVAIYQELNKKLANYVSNNPVGQRSDAAQTLAEASSPSPKTQINPALIKLTKDAIILDRVQALRPGSFESQDFSKYGQHRSLFPAKIDERAVGLDLMKPSERNSLLDEMKKKKNTAEGKKFWDTLAIVDKQGFIDTSGQQ